MSLFYPGKHKMN